MFRVIRIVKGGVKVVLEGQDWKEIQDKIMMKFLEKEKGNTREKTEGLLRTQRLDTDGIWKGVSSITGEFLK